MFARRPRARHDAGIEPLDWVRIGLVLTLVVLASGSGVAAAGLLRHGPLRDIGWTDRRLERFAVERPVKEATRLGIGVAVPASSCTLEVEVEVIETQREVLLGPVRGREPRLPFTAPECREGTADDSGRVYAVAELDSPVGTRKVLDARNRREVDTVVPRAERSQAPAAPVPAGTIPAQRPSRTTPATTPATTRATTAPVTTP